jgi:hypothetical protein
MAGGRFGCEEGRPFKAQGKQDRRTPKGMMMCPACLASLAMMIAGATSTGGVAAVLIHKFRGSWQKRVDSNKRRKSHEQRNHEQTDCR